MYRAFKRLPAALLLLLALQGCTGISYYAQSLDGHVKLLAARQNVETLIADPSQPRDLRAAMVAARDIRRYASDELALPDNDSYRAYVDTHRDYVTVAVFAAPEFSLAAQSWCFPVFGCVPYRGYFSEKAAVKFAAETREQGLDVYVTGITAYSTLGWFSDPLLNTMFTEDETYLAGLVFHELAHQRFYVRNDTAFNEAFAVVAMAAARDIGIPREKLNVNGGACALGHPIGATGARLVVTLLHALRARGLSRGVASLCIGGGEATAVAIEIVT